MAKKSSTKSKRPRKQPAQDSPLNEPHSPQPSTLTLIARRPPRQRARGTGSAAAGQAGALQGLPRRPEGTMESVEELVEEGQAHEAEFVNGVENAPEPDRREVHIHKAPENKAREKTKPED